MAKIRKGEQIIKNRKTTALKSHCFKKYVKTANNDYAEFVYRQISTALIEDEGKNGDVTSILMVGANEVAKGYVLARESGVLAGTEEIKWFFEKAWKRKCGALEIRIFKKDGTFVKKNDVVMSICGYARDLLTIERTVLNIIQRMSGIATATRKMANLASGVLVCATRKTVMGPMDKKAVMTGGGGSHRINLSDAVLIKNNHIDLAGGVLKTAVRMKGKILKARFIEMETRTRREAISAAEALYKEGIVTKSRMPVAIMFDNMKPGEIRDILGDFKKMKLYGHFLFEASGGIDAKNVQAYAKSGVDIISSGALTNSARALDFSMKIEREV